MVEDYLGVCAFEQVEYELFLQFGYVFISTDHSLVICSIVSPRKLGMKQNIINSLS